MKKKTMNKQTFGQFRRRKACVVGVAALVALLIPMNATAILDGERDDDRHPYVVHLVTVQTTRDGLTGAVIGVFQGYCSGFAVSPTLVVTAGHCVTPFGPPDDPYMKRPYDVFPPGGDGFEEHRQIEAVRVFTSEDPAAHPLYDPPVFMGFDAVGEAIPHPFYVGDFYDHEFPVHLYDVGIVVIRPEAPLDLERYAQLPEAKAAEALEVPPSCASNGKAPCDAPWLLAVGYGTHDDPSDYEPTPPRHVASVRYEGIEPWFEERYFKIRGGIEGHETVAAGSPCLADSGGPMLLDGTDIALGLAATGPHPCDYTGLGHRIDLPDVLEWIRGYI